MRKLLSTTAAAILALSIVGCDSLPFLGGAGEEEATPESSPSPTAQTPASPSPSPTPEPFASPDVPQKPPGAPALIQSSNPEERVSRLEQEVGGQAPSEAGQGRDPFAVDIPVPPPPEPDDPTGETLTDGPVVVTQLPRQRVPQLPSLPQISSPPQLGGPQPPTLPNGGGGDRRQPDGGTTRQPGPGTTRQPGPGTTRQPGQQTDPKVNRKEGQIPELASGQVPQLPQVPELTSPPQLGVGGGNGRQGGRNIPSTPDAGGPRQLGQLPQIPTNLQAPSLARSIGEGPAEKMPEIPPIAIAPRGVPNLPELPVQTPPPQHPSARPPEPVAGGGEEAPPPPPPPPSTALAEGVIVTGVVEVGNEKQVIIEAPNEATSRYVKVGQRVAGGKVLVKRVNFENGEAIVILEENDVEIRKVVGEEPAVE